jgi:hypothetical protein
MGLIKKDMSNKIKAYIAGASAVITSLVGVGLTHAAAFITVPSGTAAQYTATVASQFSDGGTLEIIALAVGIPLFFYIVHQLMGLLPKGRAKKA